MPKIELAIDTECTISEREENLRLLEDFHANQERDNVLDPELTEQNRRVTTQLYREVEAANRLDALQQPSGADQANRAMEQIIAGDPELVKVRGECLTKNMNVAERTAFMERLLGDQRQAREALIPEPAQTSSNQKWILGGTAGVILIIGLLLVVFRKQIFASSRHSLLPADARLRGEPGAELVSDGVLQAEQTYLSLLMQAAADRPVNFGDFGIGSNAYAQLRQLMLAIRDDLAEESHWLMQAEQAKLIGPVTQQPATLGDHLVSLDLLYEILEPLYPPQPSDLDMDQAVSSLADALDLSADQPMSGLYQVVMDVAPEVTGCNRLQRIVLVRSALVRAVARSLPV